MSEQPCAALPPQTELQLGLNEVGVYLDDLNATTKRLSEVDDFDTALQLLAEANRLQAQLRTIVGSFHDRAWALRGEVYGDHHHPTLGVVSVRRTAKSTKWDDENTARLVIDQHMEATGGEVVDPVQVAHWLLDAGSVNYWRVGVLKDLGIDPDDEELRFKTSGNPSITFPSQK